MPSPGLVFVGQGSERGDCIGDTRDKLVIEIAETQEGSDGLDSLE